MYVEEISIIMGQSFKSIFSLGVGDGLKETYLSQVFAYVLRNVPDYSKHFLDTALGLDQANFDVDSVDTEVSFEEGRPDIVITSSDGSSIAIEIKISANFTSDQIGRYQSIGFCKVFLIYKYLSDPKQAAKAHNFISWHEVYTNIKHYCDNKASVVEGEERYIIWQFRHFLEEIGMGIEQVKNNIIDGLKSLKNIHDEINGIFPQLQASDMIRSSSVEAHASPPLYMEWKIDINVSQNLYLCLYYQPLRLFTYYMPQDGLIVGDEITKVFPDIIRDLRWKKKWRIIDGFRFDKSFFESTVHDQIDQFRKFLVESIETLISTSIDDKNINK